MSVLKSRHFDLSVAPPLGQHTVVVIRPRQSLPVDRQTFCGQLETDLRGRRQAAELVDNSYHTKGLNGALAVLKFAAGTPPWVALKRAAELAEQTFRAIFSDTFKRIDRRVRKMAKVHKNSDRRRARYNGRRITVAYRAAGGH